LKDVGSAISVVTSEFLKDTGATDSKSLLQYTTNTEVASIQATSRMPAPATSRRKAPSRRRTPIRVSVA
jgi:hypothetical protein